MAIFLARKTTVYSLFDHRGVLNLFPVLVWHSILNLEVKEVKKSKSYWDGLDHRSSCYKIIQKRISILWKSSLLPSSLINSLYPLLNICLLYFRLVSSDPSIFLLSILSPLNLLFCLLSVRHATCPVEFSNLAKSTSLTLVLTRRSSFLIWPHNDTPMLRGRGYG